MKLPLHIQALKEKIWEAAGKDLGKVNAAKAKAGPEDGTEKYWRKVYRIIKPPKVKAKVDPTHYERYNAAKRAYQSQEFPNWVKDGHYIEAEMPDTSTSNGLTSFIIDFLTWSGHFANRTGNEGRVIVTEDKEVKRIKSSSKNGMQDIDTNLKHPNHPFGIPWKIEIKVGRDKHWTHQIAFGELVKQTGGVYSVVRDPEDFFFQYDELMRVN